MAYFAQLDENNVVLTVIRVSNDVVAYDGDPAGEIYCINTFGGGNGITWKQTSYNTRDGIYYTPSEGTTPQPDPDQSKAFRYTYAGVGMVYNQQRDAFIEAQPYPSWTLGVAPDNKWYAPIQYTNLNGPNGGGITYTKWDEPNQKWTGIGLSALPQDPSQQTFNTITNINCEWNPTTSSWVEV